MQNHRATGRFQQKAVYVVAGLGAAVVQHCVQVLHKAARDLRRPGGHPSEVEVAKREGATIVYLA